MKLWNKTLETKAAKFPLYSQDGKGTNAEVIAKIFNPYGAGTWLITEAQKEGNDWRFFGYVNLFGNEWEAGYFLLSQLENTKVKRFGVMLGLERDLYLPEHQTVKKLQGAV